MGIVVVTAKDGQPFPVDDLRRRLGEETEYTPEERADNDGKVVTRHKFQQRSRPWLSGEMSLLGAVFYTDGSLIQMAWISGFQRSFESGISVDGHQLW